MAPNHASSRGSSLHGARRRTRYSDAAGAAGASPGFV
jgi:hypothetical protein